MTEKITIRQILQGTDGRQADCSCIGNIHSTPFWLVGLSGSIMQTWGNPLQDVEPGQTYVGIELSGCTFWITVNGGVYRHIIGDDGDNDWIYCLGAGIGL